MKFLNKIIFISLGIIVFCPIWIEASVNVDFFPYRESERIRIDVIINTEEHINALEGVLFIKNGLVSSVNEGKSFVNFWIKKPTKLRDEISFAGIVPGGFSGSGLLFSFFIEDTKKDVIISLNNAQFLKNDSYGTLIPSESKEIVLLGRDFIKIPQDNEIIDSISPELFYPQIYLNETVDNKYYVNFSAQDKQSGISHYFIKEYRSSFVKVFSHKRKTNNFSEKLSDQKLKSYIMISAVDYFNNVRTVIIPPRNQTSWIDSYLIKIGLIGILIIIFCYNFYTIHEYFYTKKNKK